MNAPLTVRLSGAVLILCALGGSIGCGREGAPTSIDTQNAALVEQARALIDDVVAARWAEARKNFNAQMEGSLSSAQLAVAWVSFVRLKGDFRSQGDAEVVERPGFMVVNIVLNMEKGEAQARVTFDTNEEVAGLFFLQPGVPVPE